MTVKNMFKDIQDLKNKAKVIKEKVPQTEKKGKIVMKNKFEDVESVLESVSLDILSYKGLDKFDVVETKNKGESGKYKAFKTNNGHYIGITILKTPNNKIKVIKQMANDLDDSFLISKKEFDKSNLNEMITFLKNNKTQMLTKKDIEEIDKKKKQRIKTNRRAFITLYRLFKRDGTCITKEKKETLSSYLTNNL